MDIDKRESRSRKPIASKIILLACGVIIALLIGEIIIRFFKLAPVTLGYNIIQNYQFVDNPKICYMMKPRSYEYLNSEGFRGKEFNLKKDKGLVRIIMLGDSVTFGAFVEQASTFPELLEKKLNERSRFLSAPVRYDILNFGVCGYNIISEIELLKEYGLKYGPDIVVLNFFWNDNDLYPFYFWTFLERKDIPPSRKNWAFQYYLSPNRFRWERLLFRSHLFVYSWASINQLQERFLDFRIARHPVHKNDIVSEKLQELKKLGVDHNFKILICMHPTLDYDKKKPHPNYAKTKRIAANLGIPCFDLLPYYLKQSADPGVFLAADKDIYHPNAAGHDLIARSLRLELEKAGYIDQRL